MIHPAGKHHSLDPGGGIRSGLEWFGVDFSMWPEHVNSHLRGVWRHVEAFGVVWVVLE